MPKTRVDMRLDEGLVRRVDEYAERRLSSRTAVVQAALLAFLDDARGGVPDLPAAVASPAEQADRSVPTPAAPLRPMGRPVREAFRSGEEWQNAMRLWKARQG